MIGSSLAGVFGIALILLVTYDATQTTLSASRSGPLTNRLITCIWALFLFSHRLHKSHSRLNAAGPWITLSLIFLWVGMSWAGWLLLFCSSPQTVVNATTQVTATLMERAYFIGYTLTTLGYGDFVPGKGKWQLLVVLAASNGLFLFTLAVTYIVPVVSATVHKRQLALLISTLGHSPLQIIKTTHGDGDFDSLEDHLQSLRPAIAILGQQHLAYPILHYYHSEHSESALPVTLSQLYQALLIIDFASPHLKMSTRSQLTSTLHTIDQFMDTLGSAFIFPEREMPRLPEFTQYAETPGITRTPTEIHDHLSSQPRQKLLHRLVRKDGWEWQDVWGAEK